MGFPDKNKLNSIRDRLDNVEPSRTLSDNATTVDQIKYKICEKFVEYILDNDLTQAELARQINIDPARLNEIVKYRIDLFTIDKLIEFVELLNSDFKIEVA